MKPYKYQRTLEISVSTINAGNFMEIARIVDQLCYYTHFRALFLKTIKCGEWVVYAERVNLIYYYVFLKVTVLGQCLHFLCNHFI